MQILLGPAVTISPRAATGFTMPRAQAVVLNAFSVMTLYRFRQRYFVI